MDRDWCDDIYVVKVVGAKLAVCLQGVLLEELKTSAIEVRVSTGKRAG